MLREGEPAERVAGVVEVPGLSCRVADTYEQSVDPNSIILDTNPTFGRLVRLVSGSDQQDTVRTARILLSS